MKDLNMSKCCDTQCETEAPQGSCSSQPCSSSAEECPIDCAADMWRGSFFQAMREVQVEALKSRIQKQFGPMVDQAADALIESMGACWQSKIAEVRAAEAAHGFKEKLRDIWLQERKK